MQRIFITVLMVLAFMAICTPLMAQDFRFNPQLTLQESDPTTYFLKLFNVPTDFFIAASILVLLISEGAKRALPNFFVGGWKTQILVIIMAALVSVKALNGDILAIVFTTLMLWLAPAGTYTTVKRVGDYVASLTKKGENNNANN